MLTLLQIGIGDFLTGLFNVILGVTDGNLHRWSLEKALRPGNDVLILEIGLGHENMALKIIFIPPNKWGNNLWRASSSCDRLRAVWIVMPATQEAFPTELVHLCDQVLTCAKDVPVHAMIMQNYHTVPESIHERSIKYEGSGIKFSYIHSFNYHALQEFMFSNSGTMQSKEIFAENMRERYESKYRHLLQMLRHWYIEFSRMQLPQKIGRP